MSDRDEFAKFDTDESSFDAMMRGAEPAHLVTPPEPPYMDGLFPRPRPGKRTLTTPSSAPHHRTVITFVALEQYL